MHQYILPPLPDHDHDKEVNETSDHGTPLGVPSEWDREIRLPVNDEILTSLTLGDKVVLQVTGEVVEASKNESQHQSSRSISVVISEVSVESSDEADANYFNAGFNSGPSRN